MRLGRLNDAAIALHYALTQAGVRHGVFGGFAIGALGGDGWRGSKDVDCVASITKEALVSLLDGRDGFVWINQARIDYTAFLWSDKADRAQPVLVEVFPDNFQGPHEFQGPELQEHKLTTSTGSRFSMANVNPITRPVHGESFDVGDIQLLDAVYIFKGKLRAAAFRGKYHDVADLRFLEVRYHDALRQRRNELRPVFIGLAIRRFPELELMFNRLEVDVAAASAAAADLDLAHLPQPGPGDVLDGILG